MRMIKLRGVVGFMLCFSKESNFLLISMYYHLSITDTGTEVQNGEMTYSKSYS